MSLQKKRYLQDAKNEICFHQKKQKTSSFTHQKKRGTHYQKETEVLL
jgi:hypothetical protein